ncbi:MAG: GTP-binding protein [Candidatus Hodarchaeota archaeon]
MSHYDYTLKVLLLGDETKAKTAFTKRYCYNIFNPSERLTIGVDFHVKSIEINGTKIKLQIWDVGGEERFRFLLPTYCLGANGAFLLYDITKPSTLDNIPEWMNIIREKGGPIPIMLVGSKLHSEEHRVVSREKGISMAENYNLSAFMEICSEANVNIDEAFKVLIELILERYEDLRTLIPLNFAPIKIKPEFKINEYLELRLENSKTNIYVGGDLFNSCKYLLLNLTKDNNNNFENIDSVDQAIENLDGSMEREHKHDISAETEFWGHCSNLQAWYENDYDTRILHRNLAFPLLKALVKAGDKTARVKFKEQVALRLESGYPSVVMFLIAQGYLKYLTEEELDTILKNPKFLKNVPKWFNDFKNIPDWLEEKIRAIFNDLKCPYCDIRIKRNSIQRILKGESLKCEFCYSNLI